MSNTRVYWNSQEQLNNEPEFVAKAQNEFSSELPVDKFLGQEELSETTTSRRDFLKFVGFSVAAATLAACEAPVIKSIPYVNKPEEITPGVANYYASTYFDGLDFANIMVKTREGRPIHIEGNKHGLAGGGVNARVNSSVLSLYDEARYTTPKVGGADASWAEVDSKVKAALSNAAVNGGKVRILTNTINSPSTQQAVNGLAAAYEGADFKHVTYDAVSASGIREANKLSFGKDFIPVYQFAEAKTIVSFGADFLANWLDSIEYAGDYASRRNPDGEWMSRHYQFETTYSLTGTNADIRGAIRPSEQGAALIALHNAVAKKVGGVSLSGPGLGDDDNQVNEKIQMAANDLVKSGAHSLVVCNSNDKNLQVIVNGINNMLGAYGTTISKTLESNTRKGNDAMVAELVSEMKSGSVDVLIISGVNPVYSMPASVGFAGALSKVGMSISTATALEETAEACKIIAPDNHFLESWNDYNPRTGVYSIAQPTITQLYKTRQVQDSLLSWSNSDMSYYDMVRKTWKEHALYTGDFETFWINTVREGVHSEDLTNEGQDAEFVGDLATAASTVKKPASGLEVELYVETALGDGRQANNPWLQELPHPVTKVTWDNYIAMNPADMEGTYATEYGEQLPANTAMITVNGVKVELPVVALPGQKRGTAAIALGYGREKAGRVIAQGDSKIGEVSTIGANAFAMVGLVGGAMSYTASATMEPTGNEYQIASTQTHHTMMGRKIVNETSMKTFSENGREKWNPEAVLLDAYGRPKHVSKLDMWNDHDIALGHRWGMSIDLNSCIGCGACVTACHSENNVAVVGKDEVRRARTMSWLRVDRYFSSDMKKTKENAAEYGKIEMYGQMEDPSVYPEAVYQPVMCQHCNHAPCETVCPVAATTHSNEGLNQMTYNRCIGTRYCANNCPYKVRRFNWFNYVGDSKFTEFNPSQSDLSRMVLNPDVVVRSRGVMEKCSFCVQRIQAGKLDAKKAGRPVQDGEVTSACSTACPTHAISFGDLNDKSTEVAAKAANDRAYNLLEEIGVKPNVYYQTRVRNIDEDRLNEMVATHSGHTEHEAHDTHEGHEEAGHDSHESHDDHGHH